MQISAIYYFGVVEFKMVFTVVLARTGCYLEYCFCSNFCKGVAIIFLGELILKYNLLINTDFFFLC
jgi:hypothetical protein